MGAGPGAVRERAAGRSRAGPAAPAGSGRTSDRLRTDLGPAPDARMRRHLILPGAAAGTDAG
ncbi:hypothetical protein KPATCC21470_4816 [Kitasatospora purpeofusca]